MTPLQLLEYVGILCLFLPLSLIAVLMFGLYLMVRWTKWAESHGFNKPSFNVKANGHKR